MISAPFLFATVVLIAFIFCGVLMVRNLRHETQKELRLQQLRKQRERDEVVIGRVADYELLGWAREWDTPLPPWPIERESIDG